MCPFLHTESFCSFTSIRHFILLQLEGFIEHSNILSILYDIMNYVSSIMEIPITQRRQIISKLDSEYTFPLMIKKQMTRNI